MSAWKKVNQLLCGQMILGNNLLSIHIELFWLEKVGFIFQRISLKNGGAREHFSSQCLNMDFAYLNWVQSKLYLTLKSSFVDIHWLIMDHMVKWSNSKSCSLSILNCRDRSPNWTNQDSLMEWCDWMGEFKDFEMMTKNSTWKDWNLEWIVLCRRNEMKLLDLVQVVLNSLDSCLNWLHWLYQG